ncbi:hypothetical protein D3C71_1126200 [compost metagenome]
MDISPALWYPACAQVLTAALGVVRQQHGAAEHRHVHPRGPHRATQLVHIHTKLQLLQSTPELSEHHPQRAVVHFAHVASEDLVRHPGAGRRCHQLLTHEIRVVVAGIWRRGKLDLLTRQQLLHSPGFQRHHGREAIRGEIQRRAGHRVNWSLDVIR